MANYDQAALVATAASGGSLTQIAAAAKISVATVQRELKKASIIALLQQARSALLAKEMEQVETLREAARNRLAQLLQDEDAGYALRAIKIVLSDSDRTSAERDFWARLHAVEQFAEHGTSGQGDDPL